MKLKDKRWEEFCQQYVVDFNGARSARDAGFGKAAARVQASQMLARVVIQKRVAELMKDRSERTQITQDMVIQELAAVGFSDFKHYGQIKKNGDLELYPFKKIKDEKTRAIENIKQTASPHGKSISMKLHGKVEPLKLLGKHLGMFVEEHKFSGEVKYIVSEKFIPKTGDEEKKDEG